MGRVYDGLLESYGSAEAYLLACGISKAQLARVRGHLTE
jgi:protein-tyrosine phosphatase